MTCAITFIFLFIFARLFYVQVIWGSELQLKAMDQWTRNVPVLARRGDITDRNNVTLATSKETYTVFVRPRSVTDVDEVCSALSQIFSLDDEKLKTKITNAKTSEIKIIKHADKSLINQLYTHNLNGVYFAADVTRVYPYNELLCQTLGYASQDGNGISGLELYYDKYLSGVNGEILYESDLVGVDLNKPPKYVKAIDGLNLKLTIDYEIQQIVEGALGKAVKKHTPKTVSAIVMNPQNGEILAMSTLPSFNLNEVPYDDLDTLNTLGRNVITSDSYEPGSTFKVLTAAANVEEYLNGNAKAFSLSHVFNSSRYRVIEGSKIKCWSLHKNGNHYNQNLSDALNNSCNPVFVDIATSLGIDTFYNYLSKFGYGKATGIDLTGEAQGMLLPKNAAQTSDLARISFGQTIACTQLQLITATAAAINGGVLYAPKLVKEIYSASGDLSVKTEVKAVGNAVSEKTSRIIADYLEKVVSQGSGKQCYIDGYKVGGKTGTAQKYVNGVIARGKYVMSFVGFFPSNNPKYICLVAVDEPTNGNYGSTVAAPIVKEIFEGVIKTKNIPKP